MWLLLDDAGIRELLRDFGQYSMAEFRVSDLSSSEEETDFDFVALFEELPSPLEFDVEIMLADFESEPDLLDLNLALIALVAGLSLCLLVAVFAPVENFYHRRLSAGGDFSKIKTRFVRSIECFLQGYYPQLFSISTYEADG